jgi:hypothetical protein
VLPIVLGLVVAALGLLVAALVTADSAWAWASIGLSVLAGLLLLTDWLRRRAKRPAVMATGELGESLEPDGPQEPEEPAEDATEDTAEHVRGELLAETTAAAIEDVTGITEDVEQTAMLPATGELAGTTDLDSVDREADREVDRRVDREPEPGAELGEPAGPAAENDEPGEEQTGAEDLLVVAELEEPVLVVDELPRYHLTGCTWLTGRDTIPLAVAEARELGFTPCARCGPDAKLTEDYRTRGKSKA